MIRNCLIVAVILLSGCTTSRWVANSEPKLDFSNSIQLDSDPRIAITKYPSQTEPIIELKVIDYRLLDVPLVYESSRVIQRYRPRTGFLIAGLAAASGTIFLAEKLDAESSARQRNILRLTAGGILLGSVLNLKPVGEPIQTGETRVYGHASRSQYLDTTRVYTQNVLVRMNAAIDGTSLVSGREFVVNQSQQINLVEELSISNRQFENDQILNIQLVTENEVLDVEIPISSFMSQYICVNQRNTVVRSQPDLSDSNIITSVAPNSYLPFIELLPNGWYRTVIGASTAYVQESSGSLVWRVGSSINADFLVSTSGAQRGSVDIERNIPETDQLNQNAIALIITQESFNSSFRSVSNTHRSGDLVSEYFSKSLGILDQNIVRLRSSYFPESINEILADSGAGGMYQFENKDLLIYYAGAGSVVIDETDVQFHLLSTDTTRYIKLADLFHKLSTLSARSITLILDTDFSNNNTDLGNSVISDALNRQINSFLSSKQQSAIFLAADVSQIASNYQSVDLRTDRIHGIFTYYFLQSLQNGMIQLPQIRDNLLRNVTFTSRRLHNRGQDPIIRFNSNYSLTPQDY